MTSQDSRGEVDDSRRRFLLAAASLQVACSWHRPRSYVVTGPELQSEVIVWRRLDGSGMEHCRVSERTTDTIFDGVVVLSHDVPWRIEYEVRCDRNWHTRTVAIRAHAGDDLQSLTLSVDEHGRWMSDGNERADLHGCHDVDLGFSPSTNTLPIRRLGLNVEQRATIDAAWVEFPSLAVRRVPQQYTRLDERTYRYENLQTGFVAEVTVNAAGLVISYPPGWGRVDAQLAASPLWSAAPAVELGDAAAMYRGLLGRWEVDVIDYDEDGTRRTSQGEWHFAWALDGRAIQDVFIAPKRELRGDPSGSRQGNRFGTTIRFYDRAHQAWRIVWVNPVSGALNVLLARKQGDAIVQEGANADGLLMRWSFVEIERDRFHWVGEDSADAGATWHTRAEFFGRRASFTPLR